MVPDGATHWSVSSTSAKTPDMRKISRNRVIWLLMLPTAIQRVTDLPIEGLIRPLMTLMVDEKMGCENKRMKRHKFRNFIESWRVLRWRCMKKDNHGLKYGEYTRRVCNLVHAAKFVTNFHCRFRIPWKSSKNFGILDLNGIFFNFGSRKFHLEKNQQICYQFHRVILFAGFGCSIMLDIFLPLVVADSACSFYDTKINRKISGLVKEALSNASKFDLLSVKIIVETGNFAAKADASSRAIDSDR